MFRRSLGQYAAAMQPKKEMASKGNRKTPFYKPYVET